MPDMDARYQKLVETLEWLAGEADDLRRLILEQQYLDAKTMLRLGVLTRLAGALADRGQWEG